MREKKGIELFLQKVVSTSQKLSFGQAFFLFLSILGFGIGFCTLALYIKLSKEHGIAILVGFSLIAVCSCFWVFRHWFRNRSWWYQAQQAEEHHPDLRGSLLCSLEIQTEENISVVEQRVLQKAYLESQKIPLQKKFINLILSTLSMSRTPGLN